MKHFSYNGFHTDVITLQAQGEVKGVAVTINTDGVCVPAEEGDDFIGIAVNQREDMAGVQTEGYAETEYTGSAPTYGYCGLAAAADGKVAASDSAQTYKVIKVDTDNHIVGFIL